MKIDSFNKILIIPLSLLVLSTIGLGLYYTNSTNQIPKKWNKIEEIIKSNCKEVNLSSKANSDYISTLHSLINKKFIKQKGIQVVNGTRVIKQNSQSNSETNKCWVVFSGNKDGSGNLIYQTEEETFKEFYVTNFPH